MSTVLNILHERDQNQRIDSLAARTVDLERWSLDCAVRQESHYRDTCQWQKLAAMWYPDPAYTRVKTLWYHGSIDGWIEDCKLLVAYGASQLITVQPVDVRIRGNRALVTSNLYTNIRLTYNGGEYEVDSWAHQLHQFQRIFTTKNPNSKVVDKEAPRWVMVSCETIYIRDRLLQPFPYPFSGQPAAAAAAPAARPEGESEAASDLPSYAAATGAPSQACPPGPGDLQGRPSYRSLRWQLGLLGFAMAGDLAGYDQEDSWKPVKDKYERWFATGSSQR